MLQPIRAQGQGWGHRDLSELPGKGHVPSVPKGRAHQIGSMSRLTSDRLAPGHLALRDRGERGFGQKLGSTCHS